MGSHRRRNYLYVFYELFVVVILFKIKFAKQYSHHILCMRWISDPMIMLVKDHTFLYKCDVTSGQSACSHETRNIPTVFRLCFPRDFVMVFMMEFYHQFPSFSGIVSLWLWHLTTLHLKDIYSETLTIQKTSGLHDPFLGSVIRVLGAYSPIIIYNTLTLIILLVKFNLAQKANVYTPSFDFLYTD